MAHMPENRPSTDQLGEPADDMTLALNAALNTGDMNRFMAVLTEMARAHGMATVAQEAGLGRESLYKSMRPAARPGFATVLKVMQSLGLELRTFHRCTKSSATTDSADNPHPEKAQAQSSMRSA